MVWNGSASIYPPQKHEIKSVSQGGKQVLVRHGVHEVSVNFFVENDDKEKTVEQTTSTIGASPADDFASFISFEDPKKYWRKKEWKVYNDFLALKKKYDETSIPELKQRYKNTLERVHGTLNENEREISLTVEMQADPRIDIRTNRGSVIKTTIATQTQFAKESLGAESTFKKR